MISLCFRYKDKFSKATGNWSTSPVKVAKMYAYIDDLLLHVVNKRDMSKGRLDAPTKTDAKDPRHIRRNLAKVPHPPRDELIERHKSRFSK